MRSNRDIEINGEYTRIKPRKKKFYDIYLLAAIIVIICFGLIMLFSASIRSSDGKFGYISPLFIKQSMFAVIGLVFMIIVSLIPFKSKLYSFLGFVLYILSLVLMVMVKYSHYGVESHNAKRWLEIGDINFQPSELAKIAVILLCAAYISKNKNRVSKLKGFLSVIVIGFIQAIAAYKLTDNLSTAVIIFMIALAMVILAQPRAYIWIFIVLIFFGLIYYWAHNKASHIAATTVSERDIASFRDRRLAAWVDPYKFISGTGWQVIQGLYAIGSGGLTGKGLGHSTQKFTNIPEAQNDFIFPIICEEMGFFGALLLLLLFLAILFRLMSIAISTKNRFGAYVVLGIFLHISIQVILNISVVLNLIPTTGVSLPFISSGGTALILTMMEMGIALSVSRTIVLYD